MTVTNTETKESIATTCAAPESTGMCSDIRISLTTDYGAGVLVPSTALVVGNLPMPAVDSVLRWWFYPPGASRLPTPIPLLLLSIEITLTTISA